MHAKSSPPLFMLPKGGLIGFPDGRQNEGGARRVGELGFEGFIDLSALNTAKPSQISPGRQISLMENDG